MNGRARGAALIAAGLAAVTAAIALDAAGAASLWRHAYLLPVVAAALGFGPGGGVLAALGAVLLYAPVVLPEVERSGPTREALDGLVTFALLLAAGALTGGLAAEAAHARRRYETLLAVQRALEGEAPPEVALARLRACLAHRLRAAAVALAVQAGDRLVLAGAAALAPGSAAARALATAEPVFVPDVDPQRGPRRAFVAPLLAGRRAVGVLALERDGDLAAGERAALLGLAAHLGLALEHARLTARQREFTQELARKVAEATARLAETDRLKSEFVAIASHELRTPLTALQGFSELLATRRYAPEEVARLAGLMVGETERLGRIVSDFLDLARLERGLTPPLRRAPVDVEDALAGALEIFRRARPTHHFALECRRPLPRVDADPDALDRIVKNLVGNAVKYSPGGSCVHVRARPAAGAAAVEIEIEDEGGGIAAEDLARVFEPYFRSAQALGAAAGVGLGLAVVKSLVEAHGGSIRAENAPARGARMTVVLPSVPG